MVNGDAQVDGDKQCAERIDPTEHVKNVLSTTKTKFLRKSLPSAGLPLTTSMTLSIMREMRRHDLYV